MGWARAVVPAGRRSAGVGVGFGVMHGAGQGVGCVAKLGLSCGLTTWCSRPVGEAGRHAKGCATGGSERGGREFGAPQGACGPGGVGVKGGRGSDRMARVKMQPHERRCVVAPRAAAWDTVRSVPRLTPKASLWTARPCKSPLPVPLPVFWLAYVASCAPSPYRP